MDLHLFCLPGREDIRNILEAARPTLEAWENPVLSAICFSVGLFFVPIGHPPRYC